MEVITRYNDVQYNKTKTFIKDLYPVSLNFCKLGAQ